MSRLTVKDFYNYSRLSGKTPREIFSALREIGVSYSDTQVFRKSYRRFCQRYNIGESSAKDRAIYQIQADKALAQLMGDTDKVDSINLNIQQL